MANQIKWLGGPILQILAQAGLKVLVGKGPVEVNVVRLRGCAAVEGTQLPQVQRGPIPHLPQTPQLSTVLVFWYLGLPRAKLLWALPPKLQRLACMKCIPASHLRPLSTPPPAVDKNIT